MLNYFPKISNSIGRFTHLRGHGSEQHISLSPSHLSRFLVVAPHWRCTFVLPCPIRFVGYLPDLVSPWTNRPLRLLVTRRCQHTGVHHHQRERSLGGVAARERVCYVVIAAGALADVAPRFVTGARGSRHARDLRVVVAARSCCSYFTSRFWRSLNILCHLGMSWHTRYVRWRS